MNRRVPSVVIGIGLFASGLVHGDVSTERVPEGVSASDWTGIRAAYEAGRYDTYRVDVGYQAKNPGQQWLTQFDGRGFETTPDAGGWSWGLELLSYGRGNAQRAVEKPQCTDARGGRVEYEWDDALTEWYINDSRGLEHGYTIQNRLEVENSKSRNHHLRIELGVRGGLEPRISGDMRGVAFVSNCNAVLVNYHGLKVFDADGEVLPAWFEEGCGQQTAARARQLLRIIVDDSNATYPITIDPVAQQAYVKASNTGAGDQFGYSVAASGDTVVVGAWLEDSNATGVNGNQANNNSLGSGAAYVFVRSGGVWIQQAYLKASNTDPNDIFGWSVGVSGDTVVVGAPEERSNTTGVNGDQGNNVTSGAGAAYVFVRDGGVWSQQAYLKASNTAGGDLFGYSVAVSGDTVVVGARLQDGGNGDSGAAYVFVRNSNTWSQQAYLKASNANDGDQFGWSVGVSNDTVVVGAWLEDSNATGVNGNEADNSAGASGAAYVFVRDVSGVWSQQAYLKASNTGADDVFGYSVAVSGDTIVVGAYAEDSSATGVNGNQADNSTIYAGAAYVFVRSGTIWSQQAYLKASNTETNDFFGLFVGVSGDVVLVGAPSEDSSATGVDGNQADNTAGGSGAAYCFVRTGESWSQHSYIKASTAGPGDSFGLSLAVSGETVVVGARDEDSNATGINGNQSDNSFINSGAAYVYAVDVPECPTLGNLNCDCAVNESDLEAFVLALIDPAGYAAMHPLCDIDRADMQQDTYVNGNDIGPFVAALLGS